MNLGEAIDAVEETYEFMLAYAAQGRRQEDADATGGIRASLKKADAALSVIAQAKIENADGFMDVVRQDATPEDAIFITGSLFLVAEARAMLVV